MKNISQRDYQNGLFVHENAGFVYIEMLFLSIGIGLYFFSIPVFLLSYFINLLLIKFRLTRFVVLQGLNISWSVVVFMIASQYSQHIAILSTLIMFVIISRIHSLDNCWI